MELFALADDTILTMFRDLLAVLKELLEPVLLGFVAYLLAKIKSTAKDATEVVKDAVIKSEIKADRAELVLAQATANVEGVLSEIKLATDQTNNLMSSQGSRNA